MTTTRNVNVTIKLDGLNRGQIERLDHILSDQVVTDIEMQEILGMKLRPGMLEQERARLERTRLEAESLRVAISKHEKSEPAQDIVLDTKLPMPYATKQKLTWLAIVGPSVVTSLSILLGGLL